MPADAEALDGDASPDATSDAASRLLEVLRLEELRRRQPAQDVSFRLQRGHIHALIGPNGAGKSTMINMLTGVVDPDAGRILSSARTSAAPESHAICCWAWAAPSRT